MSKRVTQRGNTADVIAGGDIYMGDSPPRSPLAALVERYRAEVQADRNLRGFIEALQVYLEPAVGEPLGLERKLELGNRSSDFPHARRLKECFYKKLLAHQLSPAAQDIFANLLGFIQMRFESRIAPLIAQNADREVVDAAVAREVIEVADARIDDNVLAIHPQDLRGMLYYLTGVCLIKWHKVT